MVPVITFLMALPLGYEWSILYKNSLYIDTVWGKKYVVSIAMVVLFTPVTSTYFTPQVRDCELEMQRWKSQTTWHSGVCWRCHTADSLQRNAFVWSFSFTVCYSNHGSRCQAQLCQENTEMDHWFSSFGYRSPVLVFLVSFAITYRKEIPLPVFQHCYYVLLWCHSIRNLKSVHKQKPFCMGSQGKNGNHHCPVCCKYTFPLLVSFFCGKIGVWWGKWSLDFFWQIENFTICTNSTCIFMNISVHSFFTGC